MFFSPCHTTVCADTWQHVWFNVESRSAWFRNILHLSVWRQWSSPMRITQHQRTNAHTANFHKIAYDPILAINLRISKLSKMWNRKILKEFLLGPLEIKMMYAFDKWAPPLFFQRAVQCRRMISVTLQCGNEWDSIESVLCCRNTLVNDMPLSSSSPPILPAKRDNEGADRPKTSHKEDSAQSQAPLGETFFFVCFPAAFRCLFKLVQIHQLIKAGSSALVCFKWQRAFWKQVQCEYHI